MNGEQFNPAFVHAEVMSLYQALEDDITEKLERMEAHRIAKAMDKIGARVNREYARTVWRFVDGSFVEMESLLKIKVPEIHLSSDIWGDASERVLDVIAQGRAMGRNVTEIGKDLETLIKYKDGGRRVVGRWRQMIPVFREDGSYSEKMAREVWERAYLEDIGHRDANVEGYIAYGSPEAKEILSSPDAQRYITEREGLFTDKHFQYGKRLGDAGLDWRAMRVIRTESAKIFNERLTEQADGISGTGKVKRVLSQSRDAWRCDCVEAKRWIGEGKKPTEIPDKWRCPLHPNCECRDEPIFLSIDDLASKIARMVAG